MKYPVSQHLAMALTEMGRNPRGWRWFISLVGLGAALAAVYTGVWWLLLISLLTVGDLLLLYISTGFAGILDLDEQSLEELREKYSS